MNDSMAMQVVQGMHKLLGNFAHLWLSKIPVIFQNLKKFSLGELCHHTELVGGLKRVKK